MVTMGRSAAAAAAPGDIVYPPIYCCHKYHRTKGQQEAVGCVLSSSWPATPIVWIIDHTVVSHRATLFGATEIYKKMRIKKTDRKWWRSGRERLATSSRDRLVCLVFCHTVCLIPKVAEDTKTKAVKFHPLSETKRKSIGHNRTLVIEATDRGGVKSTTTVPSSSAERRKRRARKRAHSTKPLLMRSFFFFFTETFRDEAKDKRRNMTHQGEVRRK